MWYPSVGWTTIDLFIVDREVLGDYDRLRLVGFLLTLNYDARNHELKILDANV